MALPADMQHVMQQALDQTLASVPGRANPDMAFRDARPGVCSPDMLFGATDVQRPRNSVFVVHGSTGQIIRGDMGTPGSLDEDACGSIQQRETVVAALVAQPNKATRLKIPVKLYNSVSGFHDSDVYVRF